MTKVKICGITRLMDAEAAVSMGAAALGFVFAKSPRRISPEAAAEIALKVPTSVKTVGVFVNEDPVRIEEIAYLCGLDLVQLHGNEPPAVCAQLAPHVIKAFRIRDEVSLSKLNAYKGTVYAVLLDAYQVGVNGGTGKTFDWKLAQKAQGKGIPVVLSGGLNPNNISDALTQVNPFAVDVSSGIEKRPGVKDHQKMRQFMEKVTV